MSGIVITGYASLDHVIVLDGDVRSGRTTTITRRPEKAWPRLGGGPAYVAAAIAARHDGKVVAVSWVGEDNQGEVYREQLRQAGLSVDGIAAVPGARTPVSVLAYDPQGDCACLYDPGLPAELTLDENQRRLVREADFVCITIGPKAITDELIDLIDDRQILVWIVKNDPRAITPEQTAWLAARADAIFCNGREKAFLEQSRPTGQAIRAGQLIVETQGRSGASFHRDGISHFVAAEPVDVTDPTGAGDTFAGGVLAAMMNGSTDLESLGRSGIAAARALLDERLSEES
ncbi:carbohydrate kinase family protein [Rhizobium alvei]|uniref:Carbohydrate kinase family protein n=1 Tax=Rhizobium alvei TaxID=1132659 RepID=A0ABT8YT23_9HYPH|nr:carbohydrate kinase family protein [Rhizobium alvei]MDO6966839.1 carbohydrate kinase family protein [Rhizobium alvei]